MKKLISAIILIGAIAVYALMYGKTTNSSATNATTVSSSATGLKDGTYTGSSADAYWGTVQVKATIQSGKITDVQFLNYPSDRHESEQINSNAMPQLTQEAIQAQSAQVDVVSGATDTSNAFKESLSSALAQAK